MAKTKSAKRTKIVAVKKVGSNSTLLNTVPLNFRISPALHKALGAGLKGSKGASFPEYVRELLRRECVRDGYLKSGDQ